MSESKVIEVGSNVTPLKRPSLKGKVRKIGKAWNGDNLYILDNGSMHRAEELRKDNDK